MFGTVTKSFLQGRQKDGETIGVKVESLLGRVADGLLPDDKRDALVLLSELLQDNEQAKKVLGMTGLPVLCNVLRSEREDKEMVRGSLECLNQLVAPAKRLKLQDGNRQSAGAMNAEMLARGKENIDILLSLLQDQRDFYIRYYTVQLLTTLAHSSTHRVTQAVLDAPQGVVRLMDLLADKHEVVRNEALLLIVGLTHASAEIKQFAAFEGAFERLVTIIREEGGIEGGIVIQDCLELINNLLRQNNQNQLMFRETGHQKAILDFLTLPESLFDRSLARQKAANLLCLLETFNLQLATFLAGTVQAGESQREHNAAALLDAGLLEKLLMLGLKGAHDSAQPIRTQALLCLAHLITDSQGGQKRLIMSGLGWLQGTPALRQVLRVCLHGSHPQERAASRAVLRAFCHANLEGQAMLAGTFTANRSGAVSFGGEILKAFSGQDSASGRAACVSAFILEDNEAVKKQLMGLTVNLAPSAANPPTSLLAHCITALSNHIYTPGHQDQYSAAMFLRLLIAWTCGSLTVVRSFVDNPSHIPFLVDLVTARKGESSIVVKGLGALLLGVCFIAELEDEASTVLDAITTGIGLAPFFDKLEGLCSSEQFQTALHGSKTQKSRSRDDQKPEMSGSEGRTDVETPTPAENPLDHLFAAWAEQYKPSIRQHLIGGPGTAVQPKEQSSARLQALQGRSDPEQLQEARSIIQSLERELNSLRSRNRALTQQAIDLQRPTASQAAALPVSFSPSTASPPEAARNAAAVQEAERRASNAEAEVDTLRRQLAHQKEESQGVSSRLAQTEAQLQEALQELQEARAAAAKYEADLEALSSAYTGLEAHAIELEIRSKDDGEPPHPGSGDNNNADSSGEDQMDDLLACLGEEEERVERLKAKLLEMGFDPEPLLVSGFSIDGEDDLT